MQAASSENGFFQQQPILKNQLHDDPSLRRILQCLFCSKDVFRNTVSDLIL